LPANDQGRLFTGQLTLIWHGWPVTETLPDLPGIYTRITPHPISVEVEIRDTLPGIGYAQGSASRDFSSGADYRFDSSLETPVFQLGVESVVAKFQFSIPPLPPLGPGQGAGLHEGYTFSINQVDTPVPPTSIPEPTSAFLAAPALTAFLVVGSRRMARTKRIGA
jgi:hypothetical protein